MAEIQLERKEKGGNWLWILLVLALLALLAWWLLSRRGDDDRIVPTADTTAVMDTARGSGATIAGAPSEVNDFLRFVEDNRARSEMGRDHEFTADGIRRLAAALGAMAANDSAGAVALRPRVDSLRAQADSLQRSAESGQHSAQTRRAFDRSVSLMDAMQQRRQGSAAGPVNELRQAAQAVQPTRQLLEQRAEVQRFFERAADAIRSLAGNATARAA